MIHGSSGLPPPEPELRSANPGDLTAIKKLLAVCDLPSRGVKSPLANFFVAEIADEVIGVAGLERHRRSGLLRSLAVHPACRNRGLAQALCERVRTRASELGLRELYLLTETAATFFARRGFETLARAEAPREIQASEEFREICPDSAVLMHRTLE